jgi:hypothetical protein
MPSGPVTLEILDASGAVVRTFSTAPTNEPLLAGPPGGRAGRPGGIPNISALWQQTPEPFSATAGMHRVIWNPVAGGGRGPGGGGGGGGGFGRAATPLSGTFTARLTVNGRSYTESFIVKPDPRLK